ncbi:MAG: tyrosine-type recombinase/integrase, partial [Candidatus Dormibacteria bacterium]
MARRLRRTYGEGTVYRKRPDYWQAQLRIDGERVTASGRTADEARRNLAARLQERERGRAQRRPRTVDHELGAFLRIWIDDLRSTEALKPSAWHRYEAIVRLYLIPGLGARRLADLTKSDVATLIREAREGRVSGRRLSDTSLHHVHAVLRTALHAAVEQELVDRNVARLVRAPAMKHRDKVILSREEAARLLQASRGARREAASVLGVTTGMREGEILGLRRQDLDLDAGVLQVEKNAQPGYSGRMELGSPKTEAGRRTIVLPQVAVQALRAHLVEQQPWSLLVFPSRSGEILSGCNFLRHHFQPALARAGLRHMPFHDLRHSAATLLKELGVDDVTVSRILGHSTPAITMKLYGHVTPRLHREAADKMDTILGGPEGRRRPRRRAPASGAKEPPVG